MKKQLLAGLAIGIFYFGTAMQAGATPTHQWFPGLYGTGTTYEQEIEGYQLLEYKNAGAPGHPANTWSGHSSGADGWEAWLSTCSKLF